MLLVLVAVIPAIPRGRARCREELSTAAVRSGRPARPGDAVIPGLEVSLRERMLSPENPGLPMNADIPSARRPG